VKFKAIFSDIDVNEYNDSVTTNVLYQRLQNKAEEYIAGRRFAIEERINMVIKPRPQWLPVKVWKWLLKQLFYLEHLT
jgi:hypothetical protein